MANELGLHRTQIFYDWSECLRRLDKDRDRSTKTKRNKLLAEYAEIKAEAWQEWDRSKRDKERTVAETVEPTAEQGKGKAKAAKGRKKAVKQIEGRLADPHYLRVIQACLEAERKLDGLDRPIKIAPTDPEGEEEYKGLTDHERAAAITAILARVGQAGAGPAAFGQDESAGQALGLSGTTDDFSGDAA